jgi:hypothetical protein
VVDIGPGGFKVSAIFVDDFTLIHLKHENENVMLPDFPLSLPHLNMTLSISIQTMTRGIHMTAAAV